jgi:hypothetical protein
MFTVGMEVCLDPPDGSGANFGRGRQSVVFASSISSLLMQPGRPARFPAWLPWLRKVCRSGTAFLDLFRQLDAADVALAARHLAGSPTAFCNWKWLFGLATDIS